ncbi:uncharacterized protein IUM83_07341 [Phytophthora cinnamomi]|uniref:uncharacterized protein n=1 Tax=Phytophthora cinnamomi TaxID=4785 RepID=UPI00355A7FFA|nr:hypothetical protein IUM83_07341 [Phytophthora cinnamomi]
MERKVPPRGFGAPPAGFAQRSAFPPTTTTGGSSEQSGPPPPPQQPHAPQSFGFHGARASVTTSAGATRRGWRPGRVGGRHDSPLYGKHRKRPSSSSIDSNVSWSGSEIEGFGAPQAEQEQVSRLSWASSVAAKEEAPAAAAAAASQDLASAASLFGTPPVQQSAAPPPPPSAGAESELEMTQETDSDAARGVQPPKTPLGKPTTDDEGGISAAQRVGERESFEEETGVPVVKRIESAGEDEEENEDEEIAFMEEMEDPDEVLRLAEQAAAADFSLLETR